MNGASVFLVMLPVLITKLRKILFSPLHIPYHYNQITFSVKKVLLFLLRA